VASSWESTSAPNWFHESSSSIFLYILLCQRGAKLKKRPRLAFVSQEKERRLCFLQFLSGLLRLNPDLRWTPKQAGDGSFRHMQVMGFSIPPKKGYREFGHEFQVAEI